MLVLRNYQEASVSNIRGAYKQGFRSPLLALPTGGGKTVVFSYIAANTALRGKSVLILVHRIELLKQTSKALAIANVDHGLINPHYTPNLMATVQVASVQTLINRLKKHPLSPDLIIIDEAHHATAGTWRKILEHFPNALTLGVTATPIRRDGAGLGTVAGGMFDTLVLGPQVKELIDLGYLSQPIVYAPLEKIDLSGVDIKMGDYVNGQLSSVIDKPQITGNAVAHYSKFCPGEACVVFCVSVSHAENVAAEFRGAGYRFEAVDGKTSDEDRERILGGLADGSIQGVCSCDLISEGTDIPAISCVILLRPTTSLGLYLQQIGRGLRPAPGKDRCIILDHVGNVIQHGMPDDIREWSLEGMKKQKRKNGAFVKTISTKQCEACYMVHVPSPECPGCGFIYKMDSAPPKEVAGELQVLTHEHAMAIKRNRIKEVAAAKTLDQLEGIAKARGYKKGWATHVYNTRRIQEA